MNQKAMMAEPEKTKNTAESTEDQPPTPVTDSEYLWERYAVEEIELQSGTTNALNFYFKTGRVSIYKLKKKWAFATHKKKDLKTTAVCDSYGNYYSPISMKTFDIILPEITEKREEALKRMLNTAGFSNRNAGKILGQMSEKMVEHLAEIDIKLKKKEESMDFFTRVKNPSWFKALDLMRTGLYIPDPVPYVVGLTTFISNKIEEGEPIWMFIIGPSGIGKTEFTKYLITGEENFNAWVFQLSELTSKTLITGKEDADDLVPQIENKLLLFSDFTVMISTKPDEVMAIFKQLREMYDGKYTKAFGSGAGVKHYWTRFSILAGVTNKIDMYKNLLSSLGERFGSVRFKTSTQEFSEEIVKAAYHNQKVSPENIKAIQNEILSLYDNFDPHKLPPIDEEWEKFIMECAMITVNLRIPIERDMYETGRPIEITPLVEEATRLVKVYKKMAHVLCYVLEKPKFDLEALSYIYRITLDSPEALRLQVLNNVKGMAHNIDYICEGCDLKPPIVLKVLEDLKHAKLVDITQEEDRNVSNQEGTGTQAEKGEIKYCLKRDSYVLGYIKDVEFELGKLPDDQIHHNRIGISELDLAQFISGFSYKATKEEIQKRLEEQMEADDKLPDEKERTFNVEAMINQWNEGHSENPLSIEKEACLYQMESYDFTKEQIEEMLKEIGKNSQGLSEQQT
jgi:hypothetical protein